jgi:photosystem II stability/assembly factor-like uncharacterized protein
MQTRHRTLFTFFVAAILCLSLFPAAQAQWRLLGPEGGDARAFGSDPADSKHLLLGTSDGSLYTTSDGGESWSFLSRLGDRQDYVLDHIVFLPGDSNTIYVSAWSVEAGDGDLFVTHDGGRNWRTIPGMHGKSIRSFALAPSDSKILVAGTLDGVYSSHDAGANWTRITPEGHKDLHNFESLAIDPKDPGIIYAGTFHLPWKTTDGGKNWVNIKQGMIDDSDVFSIILDRANSDNVFVSACSGIYKSQNAAALFSKVQGIPNTSRRTRVLHQDPLVSSTVYAGTTEGLWRSTDSGKSFQRITPPDFILNDVTVDPRDNKRLLIATDRGGVFASDDWGKSWHEANKGFSHRQITAAVSDGSNLYVSVANDKRFGGVFRSTDKGASWQQMGLGELDVFDLSLSPSGLIAATNRGIHLLSPATNKWQATDKLAVGNDVQGIGTVHAVRCSDQYCLAAIDGGVFRSQDGGHIWRATRLSSPLASPVYSLTVQGSTAAALTQSSLLLSRDSGESWTPAALPSWVGPLHEAAIDGNNLWLATTDGLLHSTDTGAHWALAVRGVPPGEGLSIHRSGNGTLYYGVRNQHSLYISHDGGASWQSSTPAPHPLSSALADGSQLIGITLFNGLQAIND